MPRTARIKIENGIYHIIVRSISEITLFRDNKDKEKYINILKDSQNLYLFKVYAFCLMDNHAHFIIDSYGADISKIMHRVNLKYSRYFNYKYERHGHLFQDRFKSKLINDERYLYTLSLYIHNNVKDIKRYSKCPEKYRFSSLGVYLGLKKDEWDILDTSFIIGALNDDVNRAVERYKELISRYSGITVENGEMNKEKTLYIRGRFSIERKYSPNQIINFINMKFGMPLELINFRNDKNSIHIKAIIIVLLKSMCNLDNIHISKIIGNITCSRISKLCAEGITLIQNNLDYRNIVNEFLQIS